MTSLNDRIAFLFTEKCIVLKIFGKTIYDELSFAITGKFTIEKIDEKIIIDSDRGTFNVSDKNVEIIEK